LARRENKKRFAKWSSLGAAESEQAQPFGSLNASTLTGASSPAAAFGDAFAVMYKLSEAGRSWALVEPVLKQSYTCKV